MWLFFIKRSRLLEHEQIKHIAIKFRFLVTLVECKQIEQEQVVDIFTKLVGDEPCVYLAFVKVEVEDSFKARIHLSNGPSSYVQFHGIMVI